MIEKDVAGDHFISPSKFIYRIFINRGYLMLRNNAFKLSMFLILIISVFATLPVFASSQTYSGTITAVLPAGTACTINSGNIHGPFQVNSTGPVTITIDSYSNVPTQIAAVIVETANPVAIVGFLVTGATPAGPSAPINLTAGVDYSLVVCENTSGVPSGGTYSVTLDGDFGTGTPAVVQPSVNTNVATGPFIDPSTIPPDDRINYGHGDAHIGIVYARSDNGITIYGVDADSKGFLAVHVAPEDLPDCDPAPSENQLLASSADGKYTVWLLTTCEYQANIGPDAEGKVQVVTWRGVPAIKESVSSYDFNVFEVLGG